MKSTGEIMRACCALTALGFANCALTAHAAEAQAASKPAITSALSPGVNQIAGTAQPETSNYAKPGNVKIYICVSKTRPAATTDCSANAAQLTFNASNPGIAYVEPTGSNFVASLANALLPGDWVYITQKATDSNSATSTDFSDPIEVAAQPRITSVAAGNPVVSGTGQSSAGFSSVEIFVCAQNARPDGEPDCSSSQAPPLQPLSDPAVADGKYVNAGPDGSFTANLKTAPAAGAYVWVTQIATPTGGKQQISSSAPAQVKQASEPATASFQAKLVGGQTSVMVGVQTPNDYVWIWAFDPGVGLDNKCTAEQAIKGAPLQLYTTAPVSGAVGATASTSNSFQVTSSAPTVITLPQPLVAGQSLCLLETSSNTGPLAASWKQAGAPVVVDDANDFGRFRTYFTLGVQATNQLQTGASSGSSSTAGQYLELGFNSAYAIARRWKPGLATNIDVRFSPLPVGAQTTTTTASSASATISNISPNQMSVQQSVRAVGSIYAPWKVGRGWNEKTDYFTIAPVIEAGFGTLLNPSSSSTTPAVSGSSPASVQVTSASFAPSIYFWSPGFRFAWDRFSPDSNHAPQMMDQVTFSVGQFSNLPNYVCKPAPAGATNPYGSATINTACDLPPYPSCTSSASSGSGSGSGSTTINCPSNFDIYSRTLLPRINLEAILKLPNSPFVFGMEANLQQYKLFTSKRLDYLNKPGDNVRIFLGITVDFPTLLAKL
jgi:hypothetical protein